MFNFRLGFWHHQTLMPFIAICSPDCPKLSPWLPSLISYSSPNARLLNAFGLLNFAMTSYRWASVKRVASCFICFPLQVIELEGLESDMSKVHTYKLSAHQHLQFKVRI